ncbi:9218_t:CDS:2 [Diversispora eburnea]|uniref:9218_t:CDS:1 n=1 Tax=Diversispora eburnea TaxID=1213867 RepID=A0A9N8ZQB4_9GLOM|nr:9218_t:CDS:2 [Diversispora eburnea]
MSDYEQEPKFANYFYDAQSSANQVNRRHEIMKRKLDHNMLTALQNVLEKYMLNLGKDMRQYNQPTIDEVAVTNIPDNIEERDIMLTVHDNKLIRISELHDAYDPLQYPLLFPSDDEYGWHDGILTANVQGVEEMNPNQK